MMTDPAQKLYAKMRLWEFPDQYVVEPTDGSSASLLAVSRLDGSMNLVGNFIPQHFFFFSCCGKCVFNIPSWCIDEIPQSSKLRVPKIQTIYGVVGTLKLLAGKFCVANGYPSIVAISDLLLQFTFRYLLYRYMSCIFFCHLD